MLELAVRLAENGNALHAQSLEKSRHNYASHAIYGIENYLKMSIFDGLHIHSLESEY